ncbi:DNA-binding SARP family transcriptional activator [Nocardiopsis mwathae]|uniref:DNA-binding SARP family transcriptional activator n=1 Tax=Nocardiopsis mwathae TaxID=1472723 RepID=A0A7W9YEB6_9ACTN|nr:BTAD domain-containing putative transcriptional regulator [Nocardiopsis mwathae]MBB6170542.1 DNA-binding SARP family transcriptional activator [Nocardiopsis mwathae]
MEFEVLGTLEVRSREGGVRLSPKIGGLLAALLCRPNVMISEDRLVEALWEDTPPKSAIKSLHVYVHHLRQALGESGRVGRGPVGYRLMTAPGEVDAVRFEELVDQGRLALADGNPERGGELLREGLALWRGPAFTGQDTMPLVREEAARLNELRQVVAEERFDAELALGRHRDVAAELTALVSEFPYRERLRAQLMTALYRMGRSTEALEAYREGRDLLVGELGLEPGRELVRLEQAILANDPELEAPQRVENRAPRPRRADGAVARAGGGAGDGGGAPAPASADAHGAPARPHAVAPVPAQLPPDIADFTGRRSQVAQLGFGLHGEDPGSRSADADPLPPSPMVISAVAGMGGVGKTALAVHVAHEQARNFPDGQLYVNLRGSESSPADPAQVLSRFLHALGIEGGVVPDGLEERAALYRSRLADRRVLVVLDNAASERQVRPLLPGTPGCAVLITSRARLTGLEGARLIDLDVFEPQQAVALLAAIAGAERVAAEPAAAEEIVRLCAHTPLAVRIAGARLAGRPQWSLARMARLLGDEQRRLDELATGDLAVRASFELSYAGLTEGTRRAFRLMSTLEVPDFAAWAVAALLDDGLERAEDHIEALVDAQLLTIAETDATGRLRYRMHDLVRLFGRDRAEAEDSAEDRAAAQQRAFGAWLWLAEQGTEYVPGPCYATMHGLAPRWPLPSDEATELLTDPMAWFDAEWAAMSAAALQACGLELDELAWDLAGCLAKYFDVRGRFDDWRRTHEPALALCRRTGNKRGEAVLWRGLTDLQTWSSTQRSGDAMAEMYDQSQQMLDLFQEVGDKRGMSDALVMRTWGLVSQGKSREAMDSAEAALDLAEAVDYLGGRARAYHVMAIVDHEEKRYEDALGHMTKTLELARLLGNPRFEATALQFLGAAQCLTGDVANGRDNLLRSLDMARALEDRYSEVFSLLYLTRLYIAVGDPDALPTALIAAEHSRRNGMDHHLADALTLLGDIQLADGHTEQAVASLEEAVPLWRTRGWHSFLAPALRSLAQAYEATGRQAAAAEVRREADGLTREPVADH